MSIWTFVLNLSDLNIHTMIKNNYIKIMPSSTPHQKFCFYHLPTWGRAWIKLGDAWYVSNVSIIFDCSMLLYYLFWMIMGFIIHFYITFGTNLLTGGLAHIAVLLPVSVFWRKGISNGVQTEWNLRHRDFLEEYHPGGLEIKSEDPRRAQEIGSAPPTGRGPLSHGPLVAPLTDFLRLYMSIYPENIEEHNR